MEKQYLINEKDFLYLLENSLRLDALECGGVDNWCGYGESISCYLEEAGAEDFDDIVEAQIKNYTIQTVSEQ